MAEEETIPRDVGKMWGSLRELKAWIEGKFREIEVILLGAAGDNGLNGRLKAIEARVDETESDVRRVEAWGKDTVHNLWNERRPLECLGLPEIEKLRAEVDKRFGDLARESTELKKTRLVMLGAIATSFITTIGVIIAALVNSGAAKHIVKGG
jgi:hypothetical protein